MLSNVFGASVVGRGRGPGCGMRSGPMLLKYRCPVIVTELAQAASICFLLSPGEGQKCEVEPDTFAVVFNLVHRNRPVLHGQYNPVEGGSARYSYQGPGERQSQEGYTSPLTRFASS